MEEISSYILNAYSSLKDQTIDQVVMFGRNQLKNENLIPSFDENLLINLCSFVKEILENENTILEIKGDVIIVGDIHGSLHDLLRILNYVDSIPFKVIFLGDYVDRGQFSLECITLLFALKIKQPEKYFLLRGNHEFDAMCSLYGFEKEILNYHNPKKMYDLETEQTKNFPNSSENDIEFKSSTQENSPVSTEELCDNYYANHINMNCYKYTKKLYDSFIKTFSFLPIASIVNKTSLCIHGGLSPLFDKIEKIEKQIQRPIDHYDENPLLSGILWGDPNDENHELYTENPRGRGQLFNGAAVVNFLKNNNLKRIIRGHECVYEGVLEIFNEKCITIFSASSYSYDNSNKSGILKLFEFNDSYEKVIFEPICRLKKCDANYFKVQSFNNVKKLFPQIRLKSMANYGLKEKDHPNNLSGRNNGLVSKKYSFKTGIFANKKIKQCRSIPINVSAMNHRNSLMCFDNKKRIQFNHSKSIDHFPILNQNDCV